MSSIVSAAWLSDRVKEPDLRIVDAGWHMTPQAGSGRADYEREHIAGAVFFDIDAISDPSTDLPHMLASAEAFAEAVGLLGIGEGDRIVVYDHAGLFSAARVWWNFRVMGHSEVYVLDGGLPRWKAQGHAVTTEVPTSTRQPFTATLQPRLLRSIVQVQDHLAGGGQVLDARSAGRFSGADPEPRPIPSGHMPGALNLPWAQIIKDGSLLPPEDLKAAYEAAGIDIDRPVVTTCGSGVSAAILSLGLAQLGRDSAVYDGSWSEWASRDDTEIVTG